MKFGQSIVSLLQLLLLVFVFIKFTVVFHCFVVLLHVIGKPIVSFFAWQRSFLALIIQNASLNKWYQTQSTYVLIENIVYNFLVNNYKCGYILLCCSFNHITHPPESSIKIVNSCWDLFFISGIRGGWSHYILIYRYKEAAEWGLFKSIPSSISRHTYKFCTSNGNYSF